MNYVFLLLFFCSSTALAQVKLPVNDIGQVQYQEVVRVPDSKRPARQIMEQVRAWAGQHYQPSVTTEQQYDQEHNILFVRSSYDIDNQLIRYTLTIEPKFGRYRATLTDLVAENKGMHLPIQASSPTVAEINQSVTDTTKNQTLAEQMAQQQAGLYQQLDQSCRATLVSLKEAMMAIKP
ncbi:hypothetical protein [Spirosoma validum]|uniref:hypothetical protein n=1 Tax=Spirosoma validum TaxID=2771355 RepID=UPI00293BDCD6|nr:hypothetical protein [Spirosoma validum]